MLSISVIEQDRVWINHQLNNHKVVYGKKLVCQGENISFPSNELVEQLYSFGRNMSIDNPNKRLFIVINKYKLKKGFIVLGTEKKDLYNIEIYAFAFDKEILAKFPPSWKWLNGYELAEALFQVHTLYPIKKLEGYNLVKKLELDGQFGFLKEKLRSLKKFEALMSGTPISYLYEDLASQILANKNYKVYASIKPLAERIKWGELLTTEWEGSLWLIADLNDLKVYLEKKAGSAIDIIAKTYKELKELYTKGEALILSGAILISPYQIETDTALFEALGYNGWQVERFRNVYIQETPLKFIYDNHLLLDLPSRLKYMIVENPRRIFEPSSEIKDKNKVLKLATLTGMDRFGAIVRYSNFDRDKEGVLNPHIALAIPSGAGKSVFLQQMTSQFLNLTPEDLESLFKGDVFDPSKFRRDIKIRYFDKGYSALKLFQLLKIRGFNVEIFAVNPEEVFFNPLEFDEEFVVSFTNLLLEILGESGITGQMQKFFLKAYQQVKKKKTLFAHTWKIKHFPSHLEGLKQFLVERYGKDVLEKTMSEIGYYEGNPSYSEPIYSDLLQAIVNESGKEKYSEEEKEVWSKLAEKIRLIIDTNFNSWTKINLTGTQLFYMDIENLANWKFFPALIIGVVSTLLKKDKMDAIEGKNYQTFYVFDEAQNLLKTKGEKNLGYVAKTLEHLLREARKYWISVALATQNWEVFPPDFLDNIGTKIIIAGRENDIKQTISAMKRYKEIFGEIVKDVEELIFKVPFRTALLLAPGGIFSFRGAFNDFLKDLFSTGKMKTPDGYTLG